MKKGEPSQKATCLIKLANMKYKAGAVSMAVGLLQKADVACSEIADPTEKATILNQLAEAYGLVGEPLGKRNAFKKAREAIAALEEPELKAKSMISLANAQMVGKDQLGASETATKACELIADNFLPDDKASIILTAAEIYHNGGETDKRDAAVAKLEAIADSLTADRQKMAELYGQIGVSQSKMEQADLSKASFDKAMTIVKATESVEMKGFALVKLAQLQLSIKNKEGAKTFLTEAQKMIVPLTKEKSDRGAALETECDTLKQKLE